MTSVLFSDDRNMLLLSVFGLVIIVCVRYLNIAIEVKVLYLAISLHRSRKLSVRFHIPCPMRSFY
jgi:hypothetical protein